MKTIELTYQDAATILAAYDLARDEYRRADETPGPTSEYRRASAHVDAMQRIVTRLMVGSPATIEAPEAEQLATAQL